MPTRPPCSWLSNSLELHRTPLRRSQRNRHGVALSAPEGVHVVTYAKDSTSPWLTVAALLKVASLAHIVARVPAACPTTRKARSLDIHHSWCQRTARNDT